MSAEALSAVLHHSRARGTAKLVLLGIAWHTSDSPELGCFPSQETLAGYANISTRQVRRALADLETLGEIEVQVHGGIPSDSFSTNRYFILLDCPETCDSTLWHRYKIDEKVIHRQGGKVSSSGHLRHLHRTSKVAP